MRKNIFKKITTYLLTAGILFTAFADKGYLVSAKESEYTDDPGFELVIDEHPEINDPLYRSDTEEFYRGDDFYASQEFSEEFADGIATMTLPAIMGAGGSNGYSDILFGCDVSRWQGNIDWETAKDRGVSFTIIRACARGLSEDTIFDDIKAGENIRGAGNQGIMVGLYCFSQATSVEEAYEEADRLIQWADSYKAYINLPLVMDFEYGDGHTGRLADANLSKAAATGVINAFCRRVREAGYKAMVYANKDMLIHDMYVEDIVEDGNEIWLARWAQDYNTPSGGWTIPDDTLDALKYNPNSVYSGDFTFWQFSARGNGRYFGMGSGYLDLDYWYQSSSEAYEDYTISITPKEGYTGNTIWLDGVASYTEVTDGKWTVKLNTRNPIPKVATVYTYTKSGYPKGMCVYFIEHTDEGYVAKEMPELEDLLLYTGYSMKLSGENGMRYRAAMNTQKKDLLTSKSINGYLMTEYGIVAITAKNVENGYPLVLNGEKTSAAKAYYKIDSSHTREILFAQDETNSYFTGVFNNMPVNNFKVKMFSRSYAIFEKNGEQYIVYNAPYAKDLYTLAGQVLDAHEFAVGSEEYNYVKSIIAAADEL